MAASSARGASKAGPFLANVKLGASIPVYLKDLPSGFSLRDLYPAQFAMQFEIGFALDKSRSAYLTFPFQFHVSQQTFSVPFFGSFVNRLATVIVPIAFQYDIAIDAVPGLYIYPRATVGYAAMISDSGNSRTTEHGGVVIPELGIKYVFRERVNFGLEPFSLPLLFNRNDSYNFRIEYRLLAYGGVNF